MKQSQGRRFIRSIKGDDAVTVIEHKGDRITVKVRRCRNNGGRMTLVVTGAESATIEKSPLTIETTK